MTIVIILLTILAGIAALYAAEHFFREKWKNENFVAIRLDIIVCLLFAIFLLLLAFAIKFLW